MTTKAASATPPLPGDPAAQERRALTAKARRIIESAWKDDAETRALEHFHSSRRPALGPIDTTRNMLKTVSTSLAALYQKPYALTNDDSQDGADIIKQTHADGGYFALAPRNQRNVISLRECHIRPELTPRGIFYRVVTPDVVEAEADPEDPDRLVTFYEARLREVKGEWVWTWDHFDIRDEKAPVFEILLADSSRRVDLTPELEPEVAGTYPWVSEEVGPIIPAPIFHFQRTGNLYNVNEAMEMIEGTLNVSAFWTLWGHAYKDNSYSLKYLIDADVGGATEGQSGNQEVMTDGSSIVRLFTTGADKGSVGEWSAPSDPEVMGRAAREYELSLMQHVGLGSEDAETRGPESGYAISLRHSAIRKAQADMTPEFTRADLDLIRNTAILLRLQEPSVVVPESGYTITYNSLPESDEEELKRHERHERRVRLGLASRVSLMMDENPGMDRAAAEAQLAEFDTDNLRFPPPSTPASGGFNT